MSRHASAGSRVLASVVAVGLVLLDLPLASLAFAHPKPREGKLRIISFSDEPDPFSPNGDGIKDANTLSAAFAVRLTEGLKALLTARSKHSPKRFFVRWTWTITDPAMGVVRTLSKDEPMLPPFRMTFLPAHEPIEDEEDPDDRDDREDRHRPQKRFVLVASQQTWDGKTDQGQRAQDARYAYTLSAQFIRLTRHGHKGREEERIKVIAEAHAGPGELTLDTTPPSEVTVSDEGATTPSTMTLHAAWTTASDPESGVVEYQYQIRQDAVAGTLVRDWTSVGTDTQVTATGLTLIVGKTYFIGVRAINGARLGSVGSYTDGITVVLPDTTPPIGTIVINLGASSTTTPAVTLTLAATDDQGPVTQMQFSNNATFSTPEPYATMKAWTLSAGDGPKTVSVKFQDAAGNWSAPASDMIVLDTTPPETTITAGPTGTITTDTADFTWTGSDAVTPTAELMYAYLLDPLESEYSAFGSATGAGYTNLADGSYTLYVKAKDQAGHEDLTPDSRDFTVDPTADTTPPSTPAVTDDDATMSTTQLHATWTASRDRESDFLEYQYQIRQDVVDGPIIRDWTWGDPDEREVTATELTLAVGTRYFFGVRAQNEAGLFSSTGFSSGVLVVKTTVEGDVTTNTTWTLAGSPYAVTSTVRVSNNATLTIEPGVIVHFNAHTGLVIGSISTGILKAQGTAAQPITFTANNTAPAPGQWDGVSFWDTTPASILDFCILEYGGEDLFNTNLNTNLYIASSTPTVRHTTIRQSGGDGIRTIASAPVLEDNTIANNAGYGLYLGTGSGATKPTLQRTTFSQNGSYPLHLELTNFPSLFAGNTFTANSQQAIELAGGNLAEDLTLPATGLPYVVTSPIIVSGDYRLTPVTLTVQPGVTLKFVAEMGLQIGSYVFANYPGVLKAQGTAAQPITFTSNAPTPAPGQWSGLTFWNTTPASILDFCVLEYGGAGSGDNANLSIRSSSPTIQRCTIRQSIIGISVASNLLPTIRNNNITDNAVFALRSGGPVVARLNWWGQPSGPSGSGPGIGNAVNNTVLFEPWLTQPFTGDFHWREALDSPDPFTPSGGVGTFFGTLSASGNWTITIKDIAQAVMRTFMGSGLSVAQNWDGRDQSGTALADGTYTYQLDAMSETQSAAPAVGRITLNNLLPIADITTPLPNEMIVLGTSVSVQGTAAGTGFQSYILEFGAGILPTTWTQLATGTTAVTNGLLATWNTTGLTNPVYTLRLSVMATTGQTAQELVPVRLITFLNVSAVPGAFSPNGDGTQDVTTINALTAFPVNWTLTIKDSAAVVVRAFSGTGPTMIQIWNGRNAGGDLLPDGIYTYQLQGTEPESGVAITSAIGQLTLDATFPVAVITSPIIDQAVYDTVAIIGTAQDAGSFSSYRVEFRQDAPPASWTTLTTSMTPVSNGELSQWVTKQFVPEEGGLPPLKETALTNGPYTLRLTVLDQAGNSTVASVQVNAQNLYIADVSINPKIFDPTAGQTTTINYQLSLESHVTIQVFSRNFQDGTATLVATPVHQALTPAGPVSSVWDGKDDTGALLPLRYYTIKISAQTPTGDRTALYDRFFKYGIFDFGFPPAPTYTQWLIPLQNTFVKVPGGFSIGYSVYTFSRIQTEVGVPCSTTILAKPEVDIAKLPGTYTVFWDLRDDNGLLPEDLDLCPPLPFAFGDFAIGVKFYPLPETTVATASESLSLTGFSFEPAVFKPGAEEITSLLYTLNQNADAVTMTIKDPNGNHFRAFSGLPTTAGAHTIIWDGRNDAGRLATVHGNYPLEIVATKNKNGAPLEAARKAAMVVLGDYRVDAAGKRLGKRLNVIEVRESQHVLGFTSQEINE